MACFSCEVCCENGHPSLQAIEARRGLKPYDKADKEAVYDLVRFWHSCLVLVPELSINSQVFGLILLFPHLELITGVQVVL